MKRTREILLGVCPMGKFVFSHADAVVQKRQLFGVLDGRGVNYCHLDDVLPDGVVRDQGHVAAAVKAFGDRRIDALMLPHCNFGTEGAAGMIARQCGVPTLLWGPRDDAPQPDGTRLRDTLCGTLATSKVLYTLRVPFSHIINCQPEDDQFTCGLDRFLRAARVVKTLKTMRIGQVGQRIDFFWTTIGSEADLLQRFGVEVLPIDLAEIIVMIKERTAANEQAYLAELRELESWIEFKGYTDTRPVLHNFGFRDVLLELADQQDLDAFAVRTFSSIPDQLGTFVSLGMGLVHDAGFPTAPESDIHGAVTALLLEAASGTEDVSFLPDVTIRHPDNDNAVLLWHVDAPLSLRDPEARVSVEPPWILKGLAPGQLNFKLKDGPLTLCRFDGDSGGYRLGFGQGRTVAGPATKEFYTWLEVNNWPRWERQLIKGPYIHHCSCVYDHCADVLREAGTFIEGLELEEFR